MELTMSDSNEPKDEIWTTEDGRNIPVEELSEAHAKQILRMILRRNRLDREHFEQNILPKLQDKLSSILSSTDNDMHVDFVLDTIDQIEGAGIEEVEFGTEPIKTMDDIDEVFRRHGASLSKH